MGTDSESQSEGSQSEAVQKRAKWMRGHEIKKSAIKRFLGDLGFDSPDTDEDIRDYAAKKMDHELFSHFKEQFRFAGSKTLNFFVITGISDEYEGLGSEIRGEFPTAEEVEGEKHEPYFVETQEYDNSLYIVLGQFVGHRTRNPHTGKPERRLYPDECIAVVHKDKDLMHVRTADVALARKISKRIAGSVGIPTRGDLFYKPDFDIEFMNEFEELVEKHINIKIEVSEESGRTAGTVRFSSKKNDDGEYMDLIKDDQVVDELEDGKFARGYVELDRKNFALELNRSKSKIWFRSYEREDRLNEVENIIHNVLKQSGGYPQRKLSRYSVLAE